MQKKLFLLNLVLLSITVIFVLHLQAQTPSKTYTSAISEKTSSNDTITFNEYPTGTKITNQYLCKGVLFSGVGNDPPPEIYDYSSRGRVLHSHNWYDGILIKFVDPLDSTVFRQVSSISFDNPTDEQLDYITVEVYSVDKELLFTYTSASPERVEINLCAPVCAYMVLDDSANTAYAIDNLAFNVTPVGVKDHFVELPKEISLYPNYPNPFNSQTTIRYQLTDFSAVELTIYNQLGEKICGLVNSKQPAGYYKILWDGRDETKRLVSSGTYIYRLKADNFVEVKKLILLK